MILGRLLTHEVIFITSICIMVKYNLLYNFVVHVMKVLVQFYYFELSIQMFCAIW